MSEPKPVKKVISWLISQGIVSTQKELGELFGITNRSYLSQLVSNPTTEFVDKICSLDSRIDRVFITTGEGKMLKEEAQADEIMEMPKDTRVMIPLIHIDSVGGVHSQNALASSEQYIERMVPFPDARPGDVAILQSGNSMAPTIPAGAILQIRRVESWREFFGYGSDFVLWLTDERRITKQVLKYAPDPANYVTCHSYNPEAADEELPKSMIREVWKVVNVLINKGW